ncbi:MAG: 2-dehydropantoate 2-reductase N-terminal domain-containing protein [Candidatus Microbacterium colombiense]|nr:MAG: 2-dehydropantoate 2-reductase N-terminal domain-containing protein [Microbacterium sp.]
MRILMFGRGVISTIYGQALHEAGHDVEFYIRPGRAAVYGDEVRLDLIDARRSPLGTRVRSSAPVRFRETLDPGDGFDLVIVSVAHHRLAAATTFLGPRVGDATVLVFGNVWDEPAAATASLPAAQVMFGFPQAGGGFGDDDVLHGALMRGVILGMSGASPTARERDVQTAFRSADLTVRVERDMRGWLFLHFAADVGMHAQGHRHGGLARMIGHRPALRDALLTARELLPILTARGVDLARHRRAMLPYRMPTATSAAMAWATRRFSIARASLAAHTDPDADEPRAVLHDATREARRLGVPTPRLDAALAASPRTASRTT